MGNPGPQRQDVYELLIGLLDRHQVTYRLIEHPPEGRTDRASALRGHDLAAAAKSIIIECKFDNMVARNLAVVPGDRQVDFKAVRALLGARDVSMTSAEMAENLSGCAIGSIVPFSFTSRLGVIADPALLNVEYVYFNAARLDRSIRLRSGDYLALAGARFAPITKVAAGRGAR